MTTLVSAAMGLEGADVSGHFKHLCNRPVGAGETTPASKFAQLWLLQENPKNLVFISRTPLIISEPLQWGLYCSG